MSTMSMRELEENLDRVLQRVEDGEEIDISRSGKIVARLVPASDRRGAPVDSDDLWKRLNAEARASTDRLSGPDEG